MRETCCYIDRAGKQPCTGARFSFCDDCLRAQNDNAAAIARATTPLELTAAHISAQQDKIQGAK